MSSIKKLFTILSKGERKKAFFLTAFLFISAILEVLGIASIIPLIGLLSNPNLIESNVLINKVYTYFNMEDPQIFLFYLGLSFFIIFIISMAFKGLSIYFQLKFSLMCEYSIGKRLLQNYLYQPYTWFIDRHSSDLAKTILSTINQVINQGLLPFFNLISYGMVTLFIIIFLFVIDPKIMIVISLTLGLIYGITYGSFKNVLHRKGLERVKNDQDRFEALSNAFGSIKETKLGRLENLVIKTFSGPAKNFAKNQLSGQIIGLLPRYFLEAIAFGGLLLIILYLMRQSNNFSSILPILSLYVFAGYRLMPALQQVYSALTSLRFATASINFLYENRVIKYDTNIIKKNLVFKKEFSLKNITYNYPKSSKKNLNNVSVKFFKNTTTGLVGPTGSGKTTLVDVVLGLLQPQHGTLEIDNRIINKNNLDSWQNKIGYVPQQIFLADQSISSNIAFGVDRQFIDYKAVQRASKIANLHNFVIKELPDKYDTVIGEKGIRLSGGQRQRIGIARALYHKPNLLILDEATNALDNLTEKAVMDAIYKLRNKITMIIIAHRLNTIKSCDQIFFMDNGKITDSGNFEQLSKYSKGFKKFIS